MRPGRPTSWMRRSGGRPLGSAEPALEADGEVEVAARVEQAPPRRPRRPRARPRAAAATSRRRCRSTTSGRAAVAPGAHAGAVRSVQPDLPGAAHVAEAHVVGRVEARLGAEIALGERPEGLVDRLQAPREASDSGHGRRYPTVIGPPDRESHSASPVRLPERYARDPPPRHAHRASSTALEPRPAGAWASTPAGRRSTAASTSATRGRSSSSALLKRFLAHEGLRRDARRQRHRRQRQDLRRGARGGRPERRAGAGDDRRLRRRHGRARPRPARPRAAGHRDDRRRSSRSSAR